MRFSLAPFVAALFAVVGFVQALPSKDVNIGPPHGVRDAECNRFAHRGLCSSDGIQRAINQLKNNPHTCGARAGECSVIACSGTCVVVLCNEREDWQDVQIPCGNLLDHAQYIYNKCVHQIDSPHHMGVSASASNVLQGFHIDMGFAKGRKELC